jgi:hypothetical protein
LDVAPRTVRTAGLFVEADKSAKTDLGKTVLALP